MSNETIKINFLDKVSSLVKKKIKTIIVLLITIFVFVMAFIFYKHLEKNNNIKIADSYTQASILVKQKKINESKLLLENIISKNHQLYSPLALYMIIDNNIESDNSKIIVFFDKILANNSIDKENLNLIKIKKAIYLIHLDNEKLIVETLNPIINSNSVWKDLAINLISEYFLSKDQKNKADEYIQLSNNKKNK
jgi:predicted negative regulator of RcsB-dependent stress response